MALLEELKLQVAGIVRSPWTTRVGQKVPLSQDVGLGNNAVTLDGTVLYADMAKSTQLVDYHQAEFAAKVYKAYLGCAAKIIRSNNGDIAAYDGDRIMAVFHGKNPNVRSVKSALEINYAVHNLVAPAIDKQYPHSGYEIAHTIGVDSSPLFVARAGIRGSNDLVWVGKAANHAAKLNELKSEYPIRISDSVYERLPDSYTRSNGQEIWHAQLGIPLGPVLVHCSNWWRTL